MFSARFEPLMLELAERENIQARKIALVYRIFEVATSRPSLSIDKHKIVLPKTIADLRELVLNGDAYIFHDIYYRGAHAIPRLAEWFNNTQSAPAEIQFVQEQVFLQRSTNRRFLCLF